MSDSPKPIVAVVPAELGGRRLDQALAGLFPDYSRSRLQSWVNEGRVLVEGRQRRNRDKVSAGESVQLSPAVTEESGCIAQDIPLRMLYQDAHLLVIDKPAGLVVHPAAGNPDGTLQNALLNFDPGLAALPRAGIVHRLDKDTSGIMVVARSLKAHKGLVEQLQSRDMGREYRAVVEGAMVAGGTVDAPIGRHPRNRLKQAVVAGGKPAVTHYRVQERFRAHTLIAVRLETGRTHQIRVHLAHVRWPLVGDPLYGGKPRLPAGASPELVEVLQGFPRQALHAYRLSLTHPDSGEAMSWEAPLPDDMVALIEALRRDAEQNAGA